MSGRKHCDNHNPHGRHEWLDGVRRVDCPGVARLSYRKFYEKDPVVDERLTQFDEPPRLCRHGGTHCDICGHYPGSPAAHGRTVASEVPVKIRGAAVDAN